jgi:hypothetical protein
LEAFKKMASGDSKTFRASSSADKGRRPDDAEWSRRFASEKEGLSTNNKHFECIVDCESKIMEEVSIVLKTWTSWRKFNP